MILDTSLGQIHFANTIEPLIPNPSELTTIRKNWVTRRMWKAKISLNAPIEDVRNQSTR